MFKNADMGIYDLFIIAHWYLRMLALLLNSHQLLQIVIAVVLFWF